MPISEKTSLYAKDSQGNFQRINKKYEAKPGEPMAVDQPFPDDSIVFDEEDSDDLLEAGYRDAPPKQRQNIHPCERFKEIDLFGVTPQFYLNGRNKFTTYWGACCSLFVYGLIGYYIFSRVETALTRQSTYIVKRD